MVKRSNIRCFEYSFKKNLDLKKFNLFKLCNLRFDFPIIKVDAKNSYATIARNRVVFGSGCVQRRVRLRSADRHTPISRQSRRKKPRKFERAICLGVEDDSGTRCVIVGQLGELQQTGRILSRSRERNLFLTRENSSGRIKENRETIPPSSGRRNYSGCSAARARSGSTPTHNPRRRFPQAIVSLQREIRRVPEKNSQQDVRFSLLPLSSSAASCVTRR